MYAALDKGPSGESFSGGSGIVQYKGLRCSGGVFLECDQDDKALFVVGDDMVSVRRLKCWGHLEFDIVCAIAAGGQYPCDIVLSAETNSRLLGAVAEKWLTVVSMVCGGHGREQLIY